jgi:hypothetical protein
MKSLVFVCPTTARNIEIGIETDINTLLRIRTKTVRARCTACGEWHEWPVRDAFIAEAA